MITKDSIEQAYCFFHQKLRIYTYSSDVNQRDDIEYAISSFVEGMSGELYAWLSNGKINFLTDHAAFVQDMACAVSRLEKLMSRAE